MGRVVGAAEFCLAGMLPYPHQAKLGQQHLLLRLLSERFFAFSV